MENFYWFLLLDSLEASVKYRKKKKEKKMVRAKNQWFPCASEAGCVCVCQHPPGPRPCCPSSVLEVGNADRTMKMLFLLCFIKTRPLFFKDNFYWEIWWLFLFSQKPIIHPWEGQLFKKKKRERERDFPGGLVAKTVLLMEQAWVRSLVRELDPTWCN